MDEEKPSEVGYKKPPQATQFKPGKSGNPKGRPKGAKNFGTVISDELETRIAITENGKRRKISKREAIAKQLVNKAASGDAKAIPLLFNETRHHEKQEGTSALQSNQELAAEDEAILEYYIKNGNIS
jgi:Family of unknown function (DUF5681)